MSDDNNNGVLAIAGGLEPPTRCLEGSCSIQLSYATAFPLLRERGHQVKPGG